MPDLLERLGSAVDSVLRTAVDDLPDQVLHEATLSIGTQIRRLEAARAAQVREIELRASHTAEAAGTVAAWLQARTTMGKGAADELRNLGRSLERLPVMAEAMRAGEITVAHVQVLASATKRLYPERVAADEKMLTDRARQFDPRIFRTLVQRWVAVGFPDRHERDTEKQYDSRWVRLAETISGMVSISGMLDPDTARPLLLAMDALARKSSASDDRTQGQRNADALSDLGRIAINSDQLPITGGSRPSVTVVVSEESLRDPHCPTHNPAAYDDGTPLSLARLHQLCCDARYQRLVLGPDGVPINLGRITRDISPAQRRLLHLLDGGCRAGGCTKPAHATDAHHIRWWRFGGRTDLENLVLLCEYHHYLIHILGWTLDMDPGRVVTLTSPDGLRSYTSQPRGPTQLARIEDRRVRWNCVPSAP
ncbi:MAG TPA: DUF222 domain-containing protein [Mycobacteriales bacterium]|nr:DUF222 domain-containing protein [Mycobacteriales bacterium]